MGLSEHIAYLSLLPLQKPLSFLWDHYCLFSRWLHEQDLLVVIYIYLHRVEDNDDLTPIFNRQSDMLKTTYGEYFLAEMIEAQDENMHCLVAEVWIYVWPRKMQSMYY